MKKFICVICRKKCIGFGNNPYPLKKKGRCCDDCDTKVIKERIQQIKLNKKNL